MNPSKRSKIELYWTIQAVAAGCFAFSPPIFVITGYISPLITSWLTMVGFGLFLRTLECPRCKKKIMKKKNPKGFENFNYFLPPFECPHCRLDLNERF